MHAFSSTVTYSPSFSCYASDEFAAAVKVSREIHSYNNQHSDMDEVLDFEFETSPLHEETFVHFPTFAIDAVLVSKKKDNDVAASAAWKSTSPSPSWPELEEFEDFSSNCLWSPLCSPATSKISKRRRLKNFLTRSHSDGAVSKGCSFKGFMRRSHSNGSKSSSSPAVKGRDKTASYKPPIIGEGDKRRTSYLPYRQDLIGVFAVMRRLRH
ncbi:unnamed protein product [Arabis nemorensis]|uniref:Uncharacterized protein n=1 Tax=Arabis nemorensis TaxID=586526 RepID=A0A565B322_9BRAS|nr:unnamed protein product [Arabis nemorensis]